MASAEALASWVEEDQAVTDLSSPVGTVDPANLRALSISDLPAIPALSDPQLSPDGRQVAYTLTSVDVEKDSYTSAVWVVTVDGSTPPRRLTAGPKDSAARWSPDGTRLAFCGVRGEGPGQLHLIELGGGEARQLGQLPGGANDPQWSPDGHSIAVTSITRLSAATAEAAPIVLDRLMYRMDGPGMVGDRRAHLVIVDVQSANHRQVTGGDFSVSDARWSPDGTTLAFSSSIGENSDLTASSGVYVVSEVGGTPRLLTPRGAMIGAPSWFPDGQQLLVTGQESLATGHTRLFVVPLAGGGLKPVAELDRNVMTGGPGYPGGRPVVLEDSTIVFLARDGGGSHIYTASPDGQPVKVVGDDTCSIAGLSRVGDLIAFAVADGLSNGEIHVASVDGSGQKQLTHHLRDCLPDVRLPAAQSRTWTTPDGTTVHGWVLRDDGTTGAGPLLLDIHGGPHNAWSSTFDGVHLYHQELVARGWTVLIVNPRNSDGYGEDFYTAGVGGWGVKDEQDFLAPVDSLIAEGMVDASKVVVTGYSYGGYMSCWLSARFPQRWAAAIPGGVVSDLGSMAGTADVGALMALTEFGGHVWDNDAGSRQSSPWTYVADVTTPTLLLHGEADHRCPIAQSEQWFAALRTRGVPAELVRYPGASHLFILNGRPSHRADWCNRIVDWAVLHTTRKDVGARRLASRTAGLRSRLEQLCTEHSVPGATVTVLLGDEVVSYAAGIRSVATNDAVTPETPFQIGSNTKLYTATMVLRLVEQGVLELDAPVQSYLPDFSIADAEVSAALTVRHLLTHTSGIPGDIFGGEIPWGDDAKQKFVATLSTLEPVYTPGELWSYCNAGWALLGRVIEVVTGKTFGAAWRDLLIDPLGATRTRAFPVELMALEPAIGHTMSENGPVPVVDYSSAPASFSAGSLPAASGADVIRFIRLHLDGGTTEDGTRLLSEQSVALMQHKQVPLPAARPMATNWGLGWALGETLDGRRIIGHGGGTEGQISTLQVMPDERLAVVVLTNAPGGAIVGDVLVRELFEQLSGAEIAPVPSAPDVAPALDLDSYVGDYAAGPNVISVAIADGALLLTMHMIGLDGKAASMAVPLTALDADAFLMGPSTVHFLQRDQDGKPKYVHAGRAFRRTTAQR